MALNLKNPITEDLKAEQLSGKNDDCFQNRIGYEVMVNDEKYALFPLATNEEAKLGEEVSLDAMGIMKRGKVIRILSGTEENYTDRSIIKETASGYEVLERTYQNNKIQERSFEVNY